MSNDELTARSPVGDANHLLRAVNEILSKALAKESANHVFESVLKTFLEVTGSQFGFIGEVLNENGKIYLASRAISNIAWDEESLQFYREHAPRGLRFENLDTLYGYTLRTGKPLVTNNPEADPRYSGVPVGHPQLKRFVGIPIYFGKSFVGIAGIANRNDDYHNDLVEFLEPLANATGHIIDSMRREKENSQLQEQRDLQQAILKSQFEQTQESIVVVSSNREILAYNRHFLRQWSLTHETMEESLFDEIFQQIVQQVSNKKQAGYLVRSLGEEFSSAHFQTINLTDDRWLEFHAAPIRDEQGKLLGKAASFRDVTIRHREAQQLLDARHAAESASLAKSEFLANMSHEIRTPLTSILGFSELAIELVSDDQTRDLLNIVQRNGQHLLQVINDILDLSKIEAGRIDLEMSTFSLSSILEQVHELLTLRAEQKGIQFEYAIGPEVPEQMESDSTRLRQILLNLAGNSIKFTDRGFVRMGASLRKIEGQKSDGTYLRIVVEDSGIGMTATQIERVFQPFSQADVSTTRRFGGTGLGLTISNRLTEQLGGNLSVDSKPGKGTKFLLDLPLAVIKPSGGERQIVRPRRKAEESSGEVQKPQLPNRVLVAEDGPDNQRLINYILSKAGIEVEIVENGRLAVERALSSAESSKPYDVILMDLQMPVMDGRDAIRELRAQRYAGPIVALSAHALSEFKAETLALGCSDYLSKPIRRDILLDKLREYSAVT